MATTKTSSQFWLNARDFAKALAVAALSAPVTTILTSIQAGSFTIDWTAIWHMAAGSAAAYLLKNFLTPAQTVSTPPKIILFILCIGMATAGQAQNPFKPQPKVNSYKANTFARFLAVAPQPDSFVNAFRFGAQVAAFGYTFGPSGQKSSQGLAGAEYGFKHMKWNYATQKWNIQWSANFAWFAINTSTPPTSLDGIQTIAALVGFDNDLIQFGPMWNPHPAPGQNPLGLVISIGISLTN